jgi:hypothetical protein
MAAQQTPRTFGPRYQNSRIRLGVGFGVNIDTAHNRRKIDVYASNDESPQKQILLIMLVSWRCPAKHGSCDFPVEVASPYTE